MAHCLNMNFSLMQKITLNNVQNRRVIVTVRASDIDLLVFSHIDGHYYKIGNTVSFSFFGQPCELIVTDIRSDTQSDKEMNCRQADIAELEGRTDNVESRTGDITEYITSLKQLSLDNSTSDIVQLNYSQQFFFVDLSTNVICEERPNLLNEPVVKEDVFNLDCVGGLTQQIDTVNEMITFFLKNPTNLKSQGKKK